MNQSGNFTQDELDEHERMERAALKSLGQSEFLVIFIIILTITVGNMWFGTLVQGIRELFGVDRPPWWALAIISLFFTLVYAFILLIILKIPITLVF